MTQMRFDQLVRDCCNELGFDEVEEILQSGLISVAGIPVLLVYEESFELCRILVDLEPLPEREDLDLHRWMLQLNVNETPFPCPSFGLHPETGRAVLTVHVPLSVLESSLPLHALLSAHIPPLLASWEIGLTDIEEEPFDEQVPGLAMADII